MRSRSSTLYVSAIIVLVVGLLASLVPARIAVSDAIQANVALRWNDALLQGVRESTLGPPMVARALAIAHTCMFDAWAAYNERAVGTQLGDSLRRPSTERTGANREEAVSFAAYRAAVDLFPASKATVFEPLMGSLGYDTSDNTTDTTVPAGVGNVACQTVLDFRHRDGSNQLGDEPGGQPGVPYSDYTGYVPRNDPMDLSVGFEPETGKDVDHWQPLEISPSMGAAPRPTLG